jgi:tetraacyldisaccharide 4'-kinase
MSTRRVPPPTKLPSLITTPLSWVYSIGINKKNRDYDAGKGVTKLDRPVISIGNLSTGGTGKTPMVHLVVRLLESMGRRPAIAMRGYGSKAGEKGDEQLEHERAALGVPIVAQPDRLSGLRAMFTQDVGRSIDCVVLDDGFQHRKIERDLDVVLIDISRSPDRDALLPSGHLREPIESLSRAGIVVLTHCERVERTEISRVRALVQEHSPGLPVYESRHAWTSISTYAQESQGWKEDELSFDRVSGERVRVVAGIGNIDAFESQIRDHGLKSMELIKLRDHQPLSEQLIQHLLSQDNPDRSAPIFMTRKDWVKVERARAWASPARVWVPELRLDLEQLDSFREHLNALF